MRNGLSGRGVHCFILFVLLTVTAPQTMVAQSFPDSTFFFGHYTLIGRELEGDGTFAGTLVLEADAAGQLTFRRIVDADTVRGRWALEYALGDEVRVLRLRWLRAGTPYECTYQWSTDFDNFPRLTGHCYEQGKATDRPGLEAGFARWADEAEQSEGDGGG